MYKLSIRRRILQLTSEVTPSPINVVKWEAYLLSSHAVLPATFLPSLDVKRAVCCYWLLLLISLAAMQPTESPISQLEKSKASLQKAFGGRGEKARDDVLVAEGPRRPWTMKRANI